MLGLVHMDIQVRIHYQVLADHVADLEPLAQDLAYMEFQVRIDTVAIIQIHHLHHIRIVHIIEHHSMITKKM